MKVEMELTTMMDLIKALDPETLEAIASEIAIDFKHTARADSLRVLARKQRAALKKVNE